MKTYDDAHQAVARILNLGHRQPAFNIDGIIQEFHQRFGHYDITAPEVSSHTFWAIAYRHDTKNAPTNFLPRDWDSKEYDNVAPRDRFEVADGPEVGGIESTWQPGWGVRLFAQGYDATQPRDAIDISLSEAKQLYDDLGKILAKIEQ